MFTRHFLRNFHRALFSKCLQEGTFQGNLWVEESGLNDVCGGINSTLFGGQGDDQKDNDDDVDDEDVDDDKDDDEDDDYH